MSCSASWSDAGFRYNNYSELSRLISESLFRDIAFPETSYITITLRDLTSLRTTLILKAWRPTIIAKELSLADLLNPLEIIGMSLEYGLELKLMKGTEEGVSPDGRSWWNPSPSLMQQLISLMENILWCWLHGIKQGNESKSSSRPITLDRTSTRSFL